MPESDWSPYPAWFRTPHFNTDCRCRDFFPPGLEPPPFYRFHGDEQGPAKWSFLEDDHFLYPYYTSEQDCRYHWEKFNLGNGALEEITLLVFRSESYPDYIQFRLEVRTYRIDDLFWYRNDAYDPLSLWESPNPRPTVYAFLSTGWQQLDSDPDSVQPSTGFALEPIGCIENWSVGQPLPDPAP